MSKPASLCPIATYERRRIMIETMLSTIDNPYNPFDDYEDWYNWDEQAGYHTCSLLARIVVSSPELSDTDQSLAIDQAIEEIVNENVSGVHIRLQREVPDSVNQNV